MDFRALLGADWRRLAPLVLLFLPSLKVSTMARTLAAAQAEIIDRILSAIVLRP
jgi:hypothetical protein